MNAAPERTADGALPSIRARLSRALLGWSALWGAAVAVTIMLAVPHEVNELLDDTLQASAEVLVVLLASHGQAQPEGTAPAAPLLHEERFAWQVVGPAGVLLHSTRAPRTPFRATPSAGFSSADGWRVYGIALGSDGRMLYVAQTQAERREAHFDVAFSAALAALAVGLLGHLWLRAQVRHELAPLAALSQRLAGHDPTAPGASLGSAEREELQPVHAAIDDLGLRLTRRMASERAFSAHAAHALRTPLAGIDAQLAVALRESPPQLQPRLRRSREAAARLQRVVDALLAMFRSSGEPHRAPVDLPALIPRLPVEGLAIEATPGATVNADSDLLAAALLNLFDNAGRYGARHVRVSVPTPGTVRVQDDGPGVSDERRRALQQAVDAPTDVPGTGLGLRLAALVAHAHGGALRLPPTDRGFAVELVLG